MRHLAFAAIAAFAVAAATQVVAPSTMTARTQEPGVRLAEGFYQITPPPGVDEAFVVTPVRQRSANGTTMIELASASPDEEEVVVMAPRAGSFLSHVTTVVAGR